MKKVYLLLGVILASGTLFAQSPYSGQYAFSATQKHASNGITFIDNRDAIINSDDRVAYYTEDFDALTDLSTTWIGALQSGGVQFELTNVGPANDAGSSFFIPSLLSSTPTQWILLDSDSYGASGNDENATLTSPLIDASAAGSGPLKLEFQQFFAEWEQGGNFDSLYVGISENGGSTWSEVVIDNGVGRDGRPNPQLVSINITPYVAPANYNNIKVRFRWAGNWAYGWQIDNVSIADLPLNDMSVQKVFRGDLVNSIMYSRVPDEQVVPFVIGADVRNIGFDDQTNIAVNWEIFDPSSTSIGSGTSTNTLASLSNGENDTIWVTTGVAPTTIGQYRIDATVVADQVDEELANNNMSDTDFNVTDYEYGVDYGISYSSFINFAGNNDGAVAIGNIYMIETDGVIGGMRASLRDDPSVIDKIMYYSIWRFNTGSNQYEYVHQTSDYTTAITDQGNFVDLLFSTPQAVFAGDEILAIAQHYGGTETVAWGMAGVVPQGTVLGFNSSQTLTALTNPSAPMVRLLMTDFTGIDEKMGEDILTIYPNPAEDRINVSIPLTNSESTMINLLDISGKVINTVHLGNISGSKNISIGLSEMSTGIYFIEIANEAGRQVKKFVKK